MKHFTTAVLLLFCVLSAAFGQGNAILDTVFVANFESGSPYEPDDLPVGPPTGEDFDWVNYSEFGYSQKCFIDTTTVGWHPSFDATDPTQMSDNYAFTSCSYTEEATFPCSKPTRNWLILPPVEIQGTNASISWKSASYYGPYWVDGYKVLVSRTDNFPASFKDTLFNAASMVRPIGQLNGSLDPNKYIYSTGYVHANKYTLQDYFLQTVDFAGAPTLLGLFEPHSANLSMFSGQRIYIAFLHDSECDFQVQIDDIVIVDDMESGTQSPAQIARFGVYPSQISDYATITFGLKTPAQAQLSLFDMAGRMAWNWHEKGQFSGEKRVECDFSSLPAGVYVCTLQIGTEVVSKKVVKI